MTILGWSLFLLKGDIMPNWVTVKIKASKEVLQSFLNEDNNFDFSKIVAFKGHEFDGISCMVEDEAKKIVNYPLSTSPMLRNFEISSRQENNFSRLDDNSFQELVKMLENYRSTGFLHQMDFAREKWGTKWNACESSVDLENECGSFETAWSCPEAFLVELSKKFPQETIEVEYADEDLGANCGFFTLLNGNPISQEIAPAYNEMTEKEKEKWLNFACEVTGRTVEVDEDEDSED